MIILIISVITFIILLAYCAGFRSRGKEEKMLKAEISELRNENIALKQQLYEVIESPDSLKSTMIKSAVRLNIATEKMIWR